MGKATKVIVSAFFLGFIALSFTIPGTRADDEQVVNAIDLSDPEPGSYKGFYLDFDTEVAAIAYFRRLHPSCKVVAQIATTGRDLLILTWSVGSRIGLGQYIILQRPDNKTAWRTLIATGPVFGEYVVRQRQYSMELVGGDGVVLVLPLDDSGRLLITQ